jgi:hypothetical protein
VLFRGAYQILINHSDFLELTTSKLITIKPPFSTIFQIDLIPIDIIVANT